MKTLSSQTHHFLNTPVQTYLFTSCQPVPHKCRVFPLPAHLTQSHPINLHIQSSAHLSAPAWGLSQLFPTYSDLPTFRFPQVLLVQLSCWCFFFFFLIRLLECSNPLLFANWLFFSESVFWASKMGRSLWIQQKTREIETKEWPILSTAWCFQC